MADLSYVEGVALSGFAFSLAIVVVLYLLRKALF